MIQSIEAISDLESINWRMCGTAGYRKEKTRRAGEWHVLLLESGLSDCQLSGASQAREADTALVPEPVPHPVTELAQISPAQDCAMRRGDSLSSESISDTWYDKAEQKS